MSRVKLAVFRLNRDALLQREFQKHCRDTLVICTGIQDVSNRGGRQVDWRLVARNNGSRLGIASNRQPYDKVVDEQRRWQEKQSLVRCQVVCQAELRRDRTRSAKAMRSERKKEQPDFRGRAHHRAHISVRTG